MKKLLPFLLILSLALGHEAFAQAPKNVQTSQVAATRGQIIEDLIFGSGKTGSFLSGSTLSVAGTFSGTPTDGTLNLSNLTLTLPGAYLTAAQLVAENVSGVNTDGLLHWSQLVGVPAVFADGTDDGSGGGGGDFSSNTSSSVDGEILLFSGTGGKTGKRATGSGLVKVTSGVFGTATSGTDYAPATSGTSLLKGNGSGGFSSASSGTDYAPATSGSGVLKGNGSGGFSTAAAGTDYYNPGGTDVAVADGGSGASTAGGARVNLQIDNYTAHGNAGATEAFSANTAWHSVTLDQNTEFTVTDWPSTGAARTIVLEILQDATGGRIIDWSGITGSAPTISAAANSVTIVQLSTRDGGTTVYATSSDPSILEPNAAMGALAVDVAKPNNTKTISTDSTLTFSGTPATGFTFGLTLTNSDGAANHTITIPSSYSVKFNASITSFIIEASQIVRLRWFYDGTTYHLTGEPFRIFDLPTATPIASDRVPFHDVSTGLDGKVTITNLGVAGDFATSSSTATFTNKTFDASATGNVLKAKSYIYLTHPHLADGTNATIGTTATSIAYGHATFSNSVDEASNYVEYYFQIPEDIDTSVALRARLKVLLGNTDTATHRYVLSTVSVADSAVPTASTLANAINIDFAGDGSGANGDVETSAWTTLTSWAGAWTAGQTGRIRLARDGNATEDASTVNSTELGLVIEYGITQ